MDEHVAERVLARIATPGNRQAVEAALGASLDPDTLAQWWNTATPEQRRAVTDVLVESVEVRDGQVHIRWR